MENEIREIFRSVDEQTQREIVQLLDDFKSFFVSVSENKLFTDEDIKNVG